MFPGRFYFFFVCLSLDTAPQEGVLERLALRHEGGGVSATPPLSTTHALNPFHVVLRVGFARGFFALNTEEKPYP